MELFGGSADEEGKVDASAPLAARMRPRAPEEFVGQGHFFGPGKLLRRMLEADRLASVIFYGPPGTGKTALAHVIAHHTQARFVGVNAAASGVAELREALVAAKERRRHAGKRTVLFVDELHRFNKAQQDVLLPDVEEGVVLLIGATTHNPFFTVTSALVSRSQVFEFRPLTADDIKAIVRRALADPERGLGAHNVELAEDALGHLAEVSDGDARRALNALEIGVLTTPPGPDGVIRYNLKVAEDSIQRKAIVYDRDEDAHYDAASAFIKSMRGSDPDAALYWMAKMLEGGEDPRFIARRIVICAAEDVGNAHPMALVVANAALQVSEFVGLPEARIPLAQAVTYIATCPKSNAAYLAIDRAMEDVREGRVLEVPEHLRDANYPGAERLGHGKGYQYAHDHPGHFVEQDYLPVERVYYEPTEEGVEKQIKERLEAWRKRKREKKSPDGSPG
ncbi:MAG: replication-associated recombination protein A [Planctomycetes bacterium]|nr:replication-associated recombination protein A [Planctomycetota bacterium]